MNIAEFIFTSIRKKLPNINWNLGSALRELIATPLATAAEITNNALNQQNLELSIDSYVAEPEKYGNEINNIFNSLNLDTELSTNSEGTVTIFTNSATPTPVYANTVFYYEDTPIYVSKDCFPSIVPSSDEKFVQVTEIGYNSYSFTVPVTTIGVNLSLNTGVSVVWQEAPEDIYALTVSSPISGGRIAMTAAEKALKIKDYLSPNVVTLNDGITKMLRNLLPDYVVDAAFAQDISSVDKSYLYVKTRKAPGYYTYTADAKSIASGLYEISINIPGIIDLDKAYIGKDKINIRQLQITNNSVYCIVEVDNDSPIIKVDLNVYGIDDTHIIQDTINGYFSGSPYNIEIKAPDVFDIGIEFEYDGSDLSVSEINAICEDIQNMPLNTYISDTYLSTLLSLYGVTLKGSSIYSVNNINGLCYKQRISPFIYSKKYSHFAVYSGVDKVKGTHV